MYTYAGPAAVQAYIFPAVGHAAVLTTAACIDDEAFAVAAEVLSRLSSVAQMETGRYGGAWGLGRRAAAAANHCGPCTCGMPHRQQAEPARPPVRPPTPA